MSTDIDRVMRKTKSYWYEDVLGEILAGIFFIVLGIFLLAEWRSPADAPWNWIFAPGLIVLVVGFMPLARVLLKWLKERITYPRTGYVAYKRDTPRKSASRAVAAAIIGATVALIMVASFTYHQNIARLAPLFMGAAVAWLLVRVASELGLARFYVLAVWSLAIGVGLAWLTADITLSIALYYLLLGPALLVGGIVTLVRYLQAAPLPDAREHSNG
jgi:hypothetical protein